MMLKAAIVLLLVTLMILPAVAVMRTRMERGRARIRQEAKEAEKDDT